MNNSDIDRVGGSRGFYRQVSCYIIRLLGTCWRAQCRVIIDLDIRTRIDLTGYGMKLMYIKT